MNHKAVSIKLLAGILSILMFAVADAEAATIYVPDDYPTIQEAVDGANPGDAIIVRDGTYTENVNVNKDNLTIQPENGPDAAVIQTANPDDNVFEVTADYVRISGLTIKGTIDGQMPDNAVLLSHVDHCTISHNNILGSSTGIQLVESTQNNLNNNSVEPRGFDAIVLRDSSYNTLTGNTTMGARTGISLYHSSYNKLVNNTSSTTPFSGVHGIVLDYSNSNLIYLNNFIGLEEAVRVYGISANNWHYPEQITYTYNDKTYKEYLGNYCSDYTGSDFDGDGIGDPPYSIDGDSDNYPLMVPFENYEISGKAPLHFLTKWGSYGSGDGQFYHPIDIALDSYGDVYVLDRDNHRVQKLSPNGVFIAKWGSYGSGESQFDRPRGIAVDSYGDVYVADTFNDRIQKFSPDGLFITKWGSYGSGDGQFDDPIDIADDSYGNIYVVERNNHRVQKLSPNGVFIAKWGSYGSGESQFISPKGIAVGSHGNVYVADSHNHRIQKFSPDGLFIAKWGSKGSGNGQFDSPHGITVDSYGNVYVLDVFNDRIQKFSPDGLFIAKWGSKGSGNGQFNRPHGIAVDSYGNVYVSDYMNHRIQKFGTLAGDPDADDDEDDDNG